MKIKSENICEIDLLQIKFPSFYLIIRRIIEVLFVSILILIVSPLLILISLYIILVSGSPIIFIQKRPGYMDTTFNLYKFKTFKQNHGSNQAYNYNNELIPGASFLRKHKLDELPQLFNILIGDMSLIGPRPEAFNYYEQCKKAIPLYKYRFLLKPGLTGWAQVNYLHTDDIEGACQKLEYDLYYLYNINPLLDLKIILDTVKVVLKGR